MNKDTEIQSRYEDYSVEELQEALNAIFDSADDFTDSDVEQMDEIMAVLNRKNPLPQRYTAEESWKHFQENYSEELSRLGVRNTGEVMETEAEKEAEVDTAVVVPIAHAEKVHAVPASSESRQGKRCQTLIRTALIAAAVMAVMVVVTVSAAAAGINIWGWVPVWNGSTFRYLPEDSATVTSMDIPTALKRLGIDEPLFPTWLPEGFVLDEQQIVLDDPVFFSTSYLCKDRIVIITLLSLSDTNHSGITEKNDADPLKYSISGQDYYIFKNLEKTVAIWYGKDYELRISGDISEEDMIKVIDSIYEVKQ
ncbi:MAG: DUF4367 domain-containing protein [Bacteroidales bacterium]|nr:DUF4367 domain-containing protein [Bacteroidales bacterium]